MTIDPEELTSFEYTVYFYALDWDEDGRVDLDDVIVAGVKALGVEDRFQFVESEFTQSGAF